MSTSSDDKIRARHRVIPALKKTLDLESGDKLLEARIAALPALECTAMNSGTPQDHPGCVLRVSSSIHSQLNLRRGSDGVSDDRAFRRNGGEWECMEEQHRRKTKAKTPPGQP